MLGKLEAKLQKKLNQRKESGNFRVLKETSTLIDFCSNDYLGLAQNSSLIKLVEEKIKDLPNYKVGATGSRLITGNNSLVEELENDLAQLFRAEKTLIFNSGYNANLAILSTIPQRGDTIIYDEYIHASLKDGARLSFADKLSFKHNDLQDLEKKLAKAKGEKFVVIESIYSMHGNKALIQNILAITQAHQAHLIVDEAHSTAIWGTHGNGMTCEENLEKGIFARIYTFGKALGVHGACIAGNELLINYLINFARPFIYTTALPTHTIISIQVAWQYLKQNPQLATQLFDKITYFSKYAKEVDLKHLEINMTPIQFLKIGDNQNAKNIAKKLHEKGMDVRPILSPTVPIGQEGIRVCLHIFNTQKDLTDLIGHLKETIS